MTDGPRTAFVLGGGGLLGASEVGQLLALQEAGVVPDLVVGASVGAVNGAIVAAEPGPAAVEDLRDVWTSLSREAVFASSPLQQLSMAARSRTALHPAEPLRRLLVERLGDVRIEDLRLPFQCVAASIERAEEHWFTTGPLVDAVLASCAVPGLFPPAVVDGEHYLDGGIVNSVPVGRAVALGAQEVYVLHVGRLERPLRPPTKPWEVAAVALEVARRHRYSRDLAELPPGATVHLLPTGDPPSFTAVRYRRVGTVAPRIEAARAATARYLAEGARDERRA